MLVLEIAGGILLALLALFFLSLALSFVSAALEHDPSVSVGKRLARRELPRDWQ